MRRPYNVRPGRAKVPLAPSSAHTKLLYRNTSTDQGTRAVLPIWQRNYYDHVIRDDAALDLIRQYIADNPARWDEDPENPARQLGKE